MSSPMPPDMQGQPPVAKKTSFWVWVLGGCGVLIVVAILGFAVAGYVGMKMIKSAGFDSELMQKNPGLAMAKMVTAMNKDYETVKTNDREGTITVREKSTGKVITMKFDPEAKKMVIIGDDGKQSTVSVNGNGADGGVSLQAADGTSLKIGADADKNAPSWVPQYPGSAPKGAFSSSSAEGSQNTFTFKSSDSVAKILAFYTDQMKSAGFTISLTSTTETGGLIQAQDETKKRTLMVTVSNGTDGNDTSVTSIEKK